MEIFENPEIQVLQEVEELEKETKIWALIVFNDEVNTFDHVINTLMEVCKHKSHQAEQCAMIIHFKGKCAVNSGEYDELVKQRNEICRRGISAEVEIK
ncbi:ATP-dependent Clp protease adaptor ClpS [Marinilongibacter aquaticus]|uniref:ATP-dependent Clp protease adaptor ClpS n=1 Tax=Marinilongibacter aquaticus TaxID=2975157 RepID=UPI0021BD74E2|nr:ATP-dependent Clp protease adaptor ClpS [Marinilongibacter aquaticus]UBM57267.1 ATP-dependent Clp protease adaptor ClpS [Marinilongibacter aquaticus]